MTVKWSGQQSIAVVEFLKSIMRAKEKCRMALSDSCLTWEIAQYVFLSFYVSTYTLKGLNWYKMIFFLNFKLNNFWIKIILNSYCIILLSSFRKREQTKDFEYFRNCITPKPYIPPSLKCSKFDHHHYIVNSLSSHKSIPYSEENDRKRRIKNFVFLAFQKKMLLHYYKVAQLK